MKVEFEKTDDGMAIIRHLMQQRDPKDKYYKIYKDLACTKPINYLELSQTFIQLRLFQNDTVYVAEDNIPPF